MRISLLLSLSILLILPLVYGQQDSGENSQGDNGNKEIDLDAKNDEASIPGDDDKEAKPRKTTFKEERFEKLFNNRHRSKPRLLTPKYHTKPKAKLPSYIKNPPSIKPLGQDGLPVDDTIPKPTTPTPRAKQSNSRANISKTTTPSSRTRSRASTTTTTAKPSLSESDRNNKRFSAGRGRIDSIGTGRTIPASGRGRLN